MHDGAERQRRLAMLHGAQMAPLTAFVEQMRHPGIQVPYFDPLDGGTSARALFLFEKPGPMTRYENLGTHPGSGFISRNNDDSTAEATFQFMVEAGIDRGLTALWNVIPAWNGTRKVTSREVKDGIQSLLRLLPLFSELRAIVLVGKKAAQAAPALRCTRLVLAVSAHPSPIVRASRPERWLAIPKAWASVRPLLS
jgi:hypothetical protein